MRHQLVSLLEPALIEQKLDTLTGVHLAFFMLALAPQRAAAFFGETVAFLQFLKLLFEVHGGEIIGEELQSLMEDGRASHPFPSIRERCAARGRTRLHRSKLLHGRSQRLILILLAIP